MWVEREGGGVLEGSPHTVGGLTVCLSIKLSCIDKGKLHLCISPQGTFDASAMLCITDRVGRTTWAAV